MSLLKDFDFSALDDPQFGEDAVREELIAPLLKGLGYFATGSHRIVRSKRLTHPYVLIGTTKQNLTIIPDYVMYTDERAAWVLDAKAPNERVDDPAHLAQAYSYAIHREIRTEWFAVCNGREFAAFHVADASNTPRIRFELSRLESHWDELVRTLGPLFVGHDQSEFFKDFGIHLKRMGIPTDMELVFLGVPVLQIGKRGADEYRFTINTKPEEETYAMTLDFDAVQLATLLSSVSPKIRDEVRQLLQGHESTIVHFTTPLTHVTISAFLTDEIQEAPKEFYIPLRVKLFRFLGR